MKLFVRMLLRYFRNKILFLKIRCLVWLDSKGVNGNHLVNFLTKLGLCHVIEELLTQRRLESQLTGQILKETGEKNPKLKRCVSILEQNYYGCKCSILFDINPRDKVLILFK